LAGYSAAFMVAMVPGLLAAKIGQALMLPLLSAQRDNPRAFFQRYAVMFEGVCIIAAVYAVGFVIAGGALLHLAFGAQYAGLHAVIGWLAAMWSVRMVQAVPGMALLARGDTRPLLTSALWRATALVPAFFAAYAGYGLVGVAAAGVFGELLSGTYIVCRSTREMPGFAARMLLRMAYPVAAALVAAAAMTVLPAGSTAWLEIPFGVGLAFCAAVGGVALMPGIRAVIDGQLKPLAPAAPVAADLELTSDGARRRAYEQEWSGPGRFAFARLGGCATTLPTAGRT
jgi:O-antigen/teichoic acid export membrane protein